MLPVACLVPGRALVCVEPLDAERVADVGGEVVGKRREAGVARRLGREMRQLLSLQEPLPAQDVDAHASDRRAAASLDGTGVPRAGLRTHPSNLIRFVPAKGAE